MLVVAKLHNPAVTDGARRAHNTDEIGYMEKKQWIFEYFGCTDEMKVAKGV